MSRETILIEVTIDSRYKNVRLCAMRATSALCRLPFVWMVREVRR